MARERLLGTAAQMRRLAGEWSFIRCKCKSRRFTGGNIILRQKINIAVKTLATQNPTKRVRLMFQDEAGFGRINKPKSCWCPNGVRPTVPCHHMSGPRIIRQGAR